LEAGEGGGACDRKSPLEGCVRFLPETGAGVISGAIGIDIDKPIWSVSLVINEPSSDTTFGTFVSVACPVSCMGADMDIGAHKACAKAGASKEV